MSIANGMSWGGPAPAPGMAHFPLEQLGFLRQHWGQQIAFLLHLCPTESPYPVPADVVAQLFIKPFQSSSLLFLKISPGGFQKVNYVSNS